MTATEPTILATSGGWIPGAHTHLEFGPLIRFAVDLAGVTGRRPRLCHLGTAKGDPREWNAHVSEAGGVAGIEVSHLNLFPMPPTDDLADFIGGHDVVWVNGGSVVNLLAVWRAHGLDRVLRAAWDDGIVLGGISAGSLCWHVGGPTDSFGPQLRLITNSLGFLPYGNGVHYDTEPLRRKVVHDSVAASALPETHCTDDGAGLLYRGTTLVEAVTERPGARAYTVRRTSDGTAEETELPTRLIG